MSEPRPPITPEILLSHARFVRSLARRLAGRAIAGANVLVGLAQGGNTEWQPDGTALEGAAPRWVVTGAGGEFSVSGVRPGTCTLAVCAARYAPWLERLDVPTGETLERRVMLATGVTVTGTVREAGGAAAAGVLVSAWPAPAGAHLQSSAFVTHAVRTGADGSYTLAGLSRDDLQLRADGGARGTAATVLPSIEGDATTWDPALVRGFEIRGTVVDEHDAPLGGWRVKGLGSLGSQAAITDAAGLFELSGCEAVEQLEVFEPTAPSHRGDAYPCAWRDRVAAGTAGLVIRVDASRTSSAFVQGTVLSSTAEPVSGADIDVQQLPTFATLSSWGSPFFTGGAGEFRVGPLPPATYRLRVRCAGYPETLIGTFDLAAQQVLDAGTIRLARPATLVVTTTRSDQRPTPDLLMSVADVEGRSYPLLVDGAVGRSLPLAPGRYALKWHAKGISQGYVALDLAEGEEKHVDVTLSAGVTRLLRLVRAPGAKPFAWSLVTVRNRQDEIVASSTFPRELVPTFTLAPGRYRVDVQTDNGLRAAQEIDVIETALDAEPWKRIETTDPRMLPIALH